MNEFKIGDEIEWKEHSNQLYGKIEVISRDLLYGHFQGSYYKGKYGGIYKNNAIRRRRMFEIGERITAHNKSKLISGNIIKEEDCGIEWRVFDKEGRHGWFYAWEFFNMKTAHGVSQEFFKIKGNYPHYQEFSYHDAGILPQDYNNHRSYYMGNVYDYQQREATMSKYQEKKKQIENLQIGWDKEADDLINELANYFNCYVCIKVYHDGGKNEKDGRGTVSVELGNRALPDARFHFYSQCEKLDAFKQALLWLLDHSDIKKDEKEEKIKVLKEQRSKLCAEVQSLNSQIEELRND